VTEAEAIAIARAAAEQEGWAWVEPALATFRPQWFGKGGKWEIFRTHKDWARKRVWSSMRKRVRSSKRDTSLDRPNGPTALHLGVGIME
jgi:hypothetical protein